MRLLAAAQPDCGAQPQPVGETLHVRGFAMSWNSIPKRESPGTLLSREG